MPANESGKEEDVNAVNNWSRERNWYHKNKGGYKKEYFTAIVIIHILGTDTYAT